MASSSSTSLWEFDVFLSFRGKDTRRSFVSFLYKELDRKGIRTFKDDKELERGRSISPELLRAIEQSKFAVVVMSENYASSGWCLDELVKIIDCHDKGSLTAIPIFYEVDPSHVRRQTGKFSEQFRKHEKRENPEKLHKWRDALTKLANISGDDSRNWEDDSKLIDEISESISNQLISTTSSDFSDLVQMDVHIKAMNELLDLESYKEVRVIGIWGMGGVGKTTLARYIYEKIYRHFQTHCFLENIKKIYQNNGSLGLQHEFLSKTLQGGALTINSSHLGSEVIKARLGHQKVLLVADDVDKVEQLEALTNNFSWFGLGSRVIITTRDKQLLVACRVKHIYEVKCLGHDEALRLFCQSCFKQKHPLIGFEGLSARAVKLASGLPLALRVFGSFLRIRGNENEDWEIALHRLETSFNEGIMEILRISYDGLAEQDKSIFLHIACLFNDEPVDRVTVLLNDDVQNAKLGIKVLVEKSLITISNIGYITMHDLIQQMGIELARQPSINGLQKPKILCEPDEIHDTLKYNRGTQDIEALSLDMSKTNRLDIEREDFKNMTNLKFLKFYTSRYEPCSKMQLPIDDGMCFTAFKLRYLRWDGYPLKTLQFRTECLVELNLRSSMMEKLWDGSPYLGNLKKIDLSYSTKLEEFPDFSEAPNLEEIIAVDCSFRMIPPSILGLHKLTLLNLCACKKLEHLPHIMKMKSLKTVDLGYCYSLKSFPIFSRGITKLFLSLERQKELPESMSHLVNLVDLHISYCASLESLPDTIGDLMALKYLVLDDCNMLQSIPETVQKLKCLKRLWVLNGKRITQFPRLPENVTEVSFTGTVIKEIPSSIGDLCYLERLDVSESERLESLPTCIYKLQCLQWLDLLACSSLDSFPVQAFQTTSVFEENKIEEMSLRRSSPLSNLSNLKGLLISRAEKSVGMPFRLPPLSNFPSLERLVLINLNILEIPEDVGQLTNLVLLNLSGNDFETIPTSIKQLTKLGKFSINHCKNLHSLPELPLSVKNLSAHGCIALGTTSRVLNPTLQSLMLSNCFEQNVDIELISKLMASKPLDEQLVVCLPGSKIPNCFNDRYKGRFFRFSLPYGQFHNKHVVFAACITLAIKGEYSIDSFRIGWTCIYLRGNDRVSTLSGEVDPCDIEIMPRHAIVQSDHLFLFNGHLKWMDDKGAPIDNLIFQFDPRERPGKYFPRSEVNECGIRLHFMDDIEEESGSNSQYGSPSSTFTDGSSKYASPSSTFADEPSETTWNSHKPTQKRTGKHNHLMSSWLWSACGGCSGGLREPVEAKNAENRRNNYQSKDNETMNSQEPSISSRSPSQTQSFCCWPRGFQPRKRS